MGAGMLALAWLAFGGLAIYWFDGLLDDRRNPNQAVTTAVLNGVREVELKRNRSGHYIASGRINGKEVIFMLDTGATTVAIPGKLAAELNLPKGQQFQTQTANGIATSYSTRLDTVSIGGIGLRNVPAAVSPGLQMDQILLGMSFLQHIEFAQRGDTLLLRQYVDQ